MTMKQIVTQLRNQGHSIKYYVRKDGGILIQSIDGQKFTGATGNMYARAMSGTTLSTKRATQLANITWKGERAESQALGKEVNKALIKVKRKWNKAFPHKRGEIPAVGVKTAKKVRWSLEHRGKEETLRLLSEAEKYAQGKAYSKNIEHLVNRINEYVVKFKALSNGEHEIDTEPLEQLASDIQANAWMINEESIQKAYDVLYELNQGVPPHDVAQKVRRILQIP